jgi:hypothetical protein
MIKTPRLRMYIAEKHDDLAQLDEGSISTDKRILERNGGKTCCSRNVDHCKEN